MNGAVGTGSNLKRLIQLAVTSGNPEEILRNLDRFGIDWYLTEQGDLMIRYWQVGAEGLIAPERVATIQRGRNRPREGSALEWVSEHLDVLRIQYGGRWIAVVGDHVVADTATLPELLHQISQAAVEHPFITQVPEGAVIWNTTFAG
jgi:Family of unknown function (DUF5678)